MVALTYAFFAKAPFDVDGYMYWGQTFWTWWSSGHLPIIRTPGFPALIAINDHFGFGERALKIEQCLAITTGCVSTSWIAGHMVGAISEDLGVNERERRVVFAKRAAAMIFATNLPLLSYASTLLTEAIAIPLSLAALVFTLKAIDTSRSRAANSTIASTLLTVATLIRPMMALHLAISGLTLIARAHRRQRARIAVRFAIPILILFGPWIGRNFAMLGSARPLGNVGQLNIAYGLHLPYDEALGEMAPYDRDDRFFNNKRTDGFNPEQARALDIRRELTSNLKERPFELLRSRVFAQLQLWGWPVTARTEEGAHEEIPYAVLHAQHLIVLVLGAIGLWWARSTTGARWTLALIVGTATVHLAFHATPRFALPALPLLYAASAIAITLFTERLRENRSRSREASTERRST